MVYQTYCETYQRITWISKCSCGVETEHACSFNTGDVYPQSYGWMTTKCSGCGALGMDAVPPLGKLWMLKKQDLTFIGNEYLVKKKIRKMVLQEVSHIENQKSILDFFYHSDEKAADMAHANWVLKDIELYDSRKADGKLTKEEMQFERIHHSSK